MRRVFSKDFGYGTILAESWMDKTYLIKWDYRPIEPKWIPIRLVQIVAET